MLDLLDRGFSFIHILALISNLRIGQLVFLRVDPDEETSLFSFFLMILARKRLKRGFLFGKEWLKNGFDLFRSRPHTHRHS